MKRKMTQKFLATILNPEVDPEEQLHLISILALTPIKVSRLSLNDSGLATGHQQSALCKDLPSLAHSLICLTLILKLCFSYIDGANMIHKKILLMLGINEAAGMHGLNSYLLVCSLVRVSHVLRLIRRNWSWGESSKS